MSAVTLIGYARVSSADQSLEIQVEQLREAGCEADHIFAEKRSGTATDGREQLAAAIRFARKGDVFLVTRLDRLARSITDLLGIVEQLKAKGVGFRTVQQAGIDTTRPEGELFLHLLAAFAQFETAIRKERQMEGVAKAKAEGRYKGRPRTVKDAEVRRLLAEGVRPAEVARRLGIGRSSVYRAMAATESAPEETS